MYKPMKEKKLLSSTRILLKHANEGRKRRPPGRRPLALNRLLDAARPNSRVSKEDFAWCLWDRDELFRLYRRRDREKMEELKKRLRHELREEYSHTYFFNYEVAYKNGFNAGYRAASGGLSVLLGDYRPNGH